MLPLAPMVLPGILELILAKLSVLSVGRWDTLLTIALMAIVAPEILVVVAPLLNITQVPHFPRMPQIGGGTPLSLVPLKPLPKMVVLILGVSAAGSGLLGTGAMVPRSM